MPPSEYFCIWNKMQTVDNFATAEYAWVSMGLKKPAKMFNYGIHKHNHTDKIHTTQKPIPLYEFLFKTYSKENDRILDTHLGSGSIAIALDRVNKMDKMNLTITACELDNKHFKDSVKWIITETNWQSLF